MCRHIHGLGFDCVHSVLKKKKKKGEKTTRYFVSPLFWGGAPSCRNRREGGKQNLLFRLYFLFPFPLFFHVRVVCRIGRSRQNNWKNEPWISLVGEVT